MLRKTVTKHVRAARAAHTSASRYPLPATPHRVSSIGSLCSLYSYIACFFFVWPQAWFQGNERLMWELRHHHHIIYSLVQGTNVCRVCRDPSAEWRMDRITPILLYLSLSGASKFKIVMGLNGKSLRAPFEFQASIAYTIVCRRRSPFLFDA